MSMAEDRSVYQSGAVPCRQVRYRIYVDGALASVEKHAEMDAHDMELFAARWAEERMINGSTIEIYPGMEA